MKRTSILAVAALGLFSIPLVLSGADPKAGEGVYKQRCAGCHGADGSGNTSMGKSMKLKDLRSKEVLEMTDNQLFDIIAKGKGKMPGYEKSLGATKIQDIVAYLRVLGRGK